MIGRACSRSARRGVAVGRARRRAVRRRLAARRASAQLLGVLVRLPGALADPAARVAAAGRARGCPAPAGSTRALALVAGVARRAALGLLAALGALGAAARARPGGDGARWARSRRAARAARTLGAAPATGPGGSRSGAAADGCCTPSSATRWSRSGRRSRASPPASRSRRCWSGTGPAVASSIKTDLLAATLGAAPGARAGVRVRPVRAVRRAARTPGRRCAAASTWDGALEVAWRLASAGELDQQGRRGRRLLGGRGRAAARAAALRRRPRPAPGSTALVRWAYGQGGRELDAALAQLPASARDEAELADAHAAYDAVRAFEAQADRTRSSIEATAQALLRAYRFARVRALGRRLRDHRRPAARRARDALPDRRREGVQAAAADLPGAAVGGRRPRLRARDAGGRTARAAAAAVPRRGGQRRAAAEPGRDRLDRAEPQHPARLDLPRPRPGPQPLRRARPRRSINSHRARMLLPGVADLETLRYFSGLARRGGGARA